MPDWDTMLTQFDAREAKRINEMLAPKESTFDRVSGAIGHPFWFGFYIGLIAGAFSTVIFAAIWGTML